MARRTPRGTGRKPVRVTGREHVVADLDPDPKIGISEEAPSASGHDIVPTTTTPEMLLDSAAAIATMMPVLGGAVSSILGGLSQDRKLGRVNEVLWGLAREVEQLSDASDGYVRSDEFKDLLEETLRRVYNERSEEKRRVYCQFLVGAITSPGEPYEEQIHFLRVLEVLQPDHIRILAAVLQAPDPNPPYSIGSVRRTLGERLPDMDGARVEGLVGQLNDQKLTNMSLGGMMTAGGAQNLRGMLTPFGERFVRYLRGPSDSEAEGGRI